MQTNLGHELTISVMATADMFMRESQRLFRPYGLTGAQYNVINILAERPDGISQRELGDLLVVDRSNVTGLLDRLEKAGWVRRADHPVDRRVYQVFLTAEGKKLWGKVHPRYLAAVEQVASAVSRTRARECLETLKALEAAAAKLDLPGA